VNINARLSERYYSCFIFWSKTDENEISLLDKILKKLVEALRFASGRNIETTFVIIDSKSIKNTDTAKEKGSDAGKKISGIKLHHAVDILGLPHAIYIKQLSPTDSGYSGFANAIVERTFAWLESAFV